MTVTPDWATQVPNYPVNDTSGLATDDSNAPSMVQVQNMLAGTQTDTVGQVATAMGGTKTQGWVPGQFITAVVEGFVTGIAGIINGIFAAFSGLVGGTGGINDAVGVMVASAATIAATSAAVQSMQQQDAADSNNGITVWVDFSTFANSASITGLTQIASVGSGALGISSGNAVLSAGSGTVKAVDLHGTPTNTDDQIVTAIYAVGPSTTNANNILVCRSNAGGTTYVYVSFSWTQAILHNVVSGVDTTLKTVTYSGPTFYAGGAYELIAGFDGSSNPTFALAVNGVAVLTFTDTTGVTNHGSLYRYCGLGLQRLTGGSAAKVADFGFVDDAPAALIGDFFQVQNTSATTIALTNNASPVLLANSFFATLVNQTSNYTYTPATANKLTVAKAGIYVVKVAVQWVPNSAATYAYFGVGVFKNGLLWDFDFEAMANPGALPFFMIKSREFLVPLAVGDYIQPCVVSTSNTSTAKNTIVGGGDSSFYCALLNTGSAAAA